MIAAWHARVTSSSWLSRMPARIKRPPGDRISARCSCSKPIDHRRQDVGSHEWCTPDPEIRQPRPRERSRRPGSVRDSRPLASALARAFAIELRSMSTPRADFTPSFERGDRKDPRPTTDVDEVRGRGRGGIQQHVQELKAQLRARMCARSERHAGINSHCNPTRALVLQTTPEESSACGQWGWADSAASTLPSNLCWQECDTMARGRA